MKPIHFAFVAALTLGLAACGSNEDTLGDNIDGNLQSDELNALADDAAIDANAEMEALGNAQQQAEPEPATDPATNVADPVTTEPSEVEDDVQGM